MARAQAERAQMLTEVADGERRLNVLRADANETTPAVLARTHRPCGPRQTHAVCDQRFPQRASSEEVQGLRWVTSEARVCGGGDCGLPE